MAGRTQAGEDHLENQLPKSRRLHSLTLRPHSGHSLAARPTAGLDRSCALAAWTEKHGSPRELKSLQRCHKDFNTPDAALGQMDYVVKDVMIGGFALVAAPAEYGVTGINTFIVSQDGVVYEKDFGSKPLDEFKKMELFNPDKSWTPVDDDE